MKILYIHQYFKTPDEPGGTRSYWIAKELISAGHEVTMITASSKFDEEIYKKNIDGIDVVYVKEPYSQNMSFYKRLKAFVGFMIKSTRIGFKYSDIDLVIATSTPLTIGIPALVLKKFKKIPYIFEVRDLWPEVPIQMGGIKNPVLIWIAKLLEKKIYQNAHHIIALSPGMQDGVVKYVARDKTSMIPNMAKIDEFWPREKNYSLMSQLGLSKNTFKVIHFGALGIANGAHHIIDAAYLLNNDPTIDFLFVGGGSTEEVLKKEVKISKLTNVKFLGGYPMKEVSEIVNFCDVSIVSFLDLPILYTNSPNKLFDSLSAGKPIIVNSAGWTKKMVEENKCGFYANPNNAMDLVNKIKILQNDSDLKNEMGNNSRVLSEIKYDKSILCKQFLDVIHTLSLKN